MRGETYLINHPSLAILSRPTGGKRLPVTVPAGSRVRVLEGPMDGTRLVEVDWDGDIVLMFTEDLRNHGTLISQAPVTRDDGRRSAD